MNSRFGRYLTPSVSVDVTIDEFDDEDIISYLENNGYVVSTREEYDRLTANKPKDDGMIFDRREFTDKLLEMLGMGHWETKEAVMEKIDGLFAA